MSTKKPKSAKTKPYRDFQRLGKNFTANIIGIKKTMPLVMKNIIENARKSKDSWDGFVQTKSNKKGDMSLNLDEYLYFKELAKERRNNFVPVSIVPESLFISLVNFFDAFIKDIIKSIYVLRPEILVGTEKKISISEILDLKDFDEINSYLIDREIETIYGESRTKLFNWLKEKLGVEYTPEKKLWAEFIEIFERRNLLVHCGGVVDNRYIKTCRNIGLETDKTVKKGFKVKIRAEYFYRASTTVFVLGTEVLHSVWKKILPKHLGESDTELIDSIVECLDERNYRGAFLLADFALQRLKLFSNEEIRLIYTINKALALKFGGQKNKALKLLKEQDWTSSDDKFKLAVSVIREKYTESVKVMSRLGNKAEMKVAYKFWPLFDGFRNTDKFLKAYEKIFKESYFALKTQNLEQGLVSNTATN